MVGREGERGKEGELGSVEWGRRRRSLGRREGGGKEEGVEESSSLSLLSPLRIYPRKGSRGGARAQCCWPFFPFCPLPPSLFASSSSSSSSSLSSPSSSSSSLLSCHAESFSQSRSETAARPSECLSHRAEGSNQLGPRRASTLSCCPGHKRTILSPATERKDEEVAVVVAVQVRLHVAVKDGDEED